MAKIKGKDLSITLGSTEFNMDVKSVVLESEEADNDDVTFAELSAGSPVQWFLSIEAVTDYSAASLHTYLDSNAGSTVAFVLKPKGGTTASVTQPHWTGNATILSRPPVGGTANETFTFEARLDLTAAPLRKTA